MNEASQAIGEIRRAEMEGAQRVEEARTNASEMVAEARAEGQRLLADARSRGRHSARKRLEAAIEDATAAANEIRAGGGAGEGKLAEMAGESMDLLVEEMVRAVLAPPSEPGK